MSFAGDAIASGVLLAGRYRLVRRIGAGSMGEVFEAVDTRHRRRVALKTLPRLSGEALLLFKREYRSLLEVQHRGLVTLGELACDGDLWFFTMELVEGVEWVEYAVSGGEETVRAALAGLGEALAALHASGRVHRDLKPSNVLVESDGRVVVLDFGVVRDDRALDGTRSVDGSLRGTPLYMAPEQAAGHAVTSAADLYSVGAMLYQALTGHLPIDGTPLHVLMRKQREIPASPSSIRPDVAPDLDELARALLAIDPSARPDAGALVAAGKLGTSEASRPGARSIVPAGRGRDARFVGREREIDLLEAAYVDSRTRPVSVVIEGPSGLGKSALAERFARATHADGERAFVFTSRCLDRENVPFKVLDGAIDGLARTLERLPAAKVKSFAPRDRAFAALVDTFPVLESVRALDRGRVVVPAKDRGEQRRRAFEALRHVLDRLARVRPIVVIVDDLQWADDDSRVALEELLLPSEGPPVLWIFTARPGATHRVREAAPEGDIRTIELGGLSLDAAAALARELGCGDEDARAIAHESAGHPMFVAELARSLCESVGGPLEAPPSLDVALLRRLDSTDASVRHLVSLASVAAIPLPVEVAWVAAGLDMAEGRRALTTAVDSALLRFGDDRGESIEPFHDRVRESVSGRLAESERVGLNEVLAAALGQSELGSRRPDVLASHLLAAGHASEARRAFLRAGDLAAAATGFAAAAAAYERALAIRCERDEDTARVLESLGQALYHEGRIVEASARLLEAAEFGAEDARTRRRRDAGLIVMDAGDVTRGREVFEPVLRSHDERWPDFGVVFYFRFVLQLVVCFVWAIRSTSRPIDEGRSPRDARAIERSSILLDLAYRVAMIDYVAGIWFAMRGLRVALRARDAIATGRAVCTVGSTLSAGALRTKRWLTIGERYAAAYPDETELVGAFHAYRAIDGFHDERHDATTLESHERFEAIAASAPSRFLALRRILSTVRCWEGVHFADFRNHASVLAYARDAVRHGNPLDLLLMAVWNFPAYLAEGEFDESESLAGAARRAIPKHARQPLRDLLEMLWDVVRDRIHGASLLAYHAPYRAAFRSDIRFLRVSRFNWSVLVATGLTSAMRRGESTDAWLAEANELVRGFDDPPDERPITYGNLAYLRALVLLATEGEASAIRELRTLLAHDEKHGQTGRRLFTTHALGRLVGGDEGKRMQREAETELRARGAKDPRAFCMVFAPLPSDPDTLTLGERRPSSVVASTH